MNFINLRKDIFFRKLSFEFKKKAIIRLVIYPHINAIFTFKAKEYSVANRLPLKVLNTPINTKIKNCLFKKNVNSFFITIALIPKCSAYIPLAISIRYCP